MPENKKKTHPFNLRRIEKSANYSLTLKQAI